MEYRSKEWFDAIDKISNGKWMTEAYQNFVAEQGFPAPWDVLPESEKRIYRYNYEESLKRLEKRRLSKLKSLNIPTAYYNAESKYIDQITNKYSCVIGTSFSGKTTVLCSYLLNKTDGIYMKANEYQKHMEQNNTTSDEYTWEEVLQKRKYLVMDDVGDELVRKGYNNYVLEHLEWRMDYEMPFVFSTRLSVDELKIYSVKLLTRMSKKFIQTIILGEENGL